jgi:hypothetical protein
MCPVMMPAGQIKKARMNAAIAIPLVGRDGPFEPL